MYSCFTLYGDIFGSRYTRRRPFEMKGAQWVSTRERGARRRRQTTGLTARTYRTLVQSVVRNGSRPDLSVKSFRQVSVRSQT